ncbi:hypothetical protein [Caenimonas soli]|uniref:hypothetical protein n=1 Tax=Caenimonas soli TaxID=2735555 RepID=UPI001553781B|nr:hypothetical protein [Caenimonas soli]NPC58165.1 hypothetical protein [Caenimonas soli]
MFDSTIDILALSICALGLIALPLIKFIKRRKAELEAELLRQCPELVEIVASKTGSESSCR